MDHIFIMILATRNTIKRRILSLKHNTEVDDKSIQDLWHLVRANKCHMTGPSFSYMNIFSKVIKRDI